MRRSSEVPQSAAGSRLDVWLTEHHNLPRSSVQRLLKNAAITLNGQPARPSYTLRGGEKVESDIPEPVVPQVTVPRLEVVYQDADVVIINKPAGVMVHPGNGRAGEGTVADFARDLTTDPDPHRPGIVHRLDRETSGLMILARTLEAKTFLQKQFKQHLVEKTYIALVAGRLRPDSAVIKLPLSRSSTDPLRRIPNPNGKEAETSYQVIEEYPGFSLVEAKPRTGRTHQIRAHFAALGHPIVGDYRYGGPDGPNGKLARQFLHAVQLSITLPNGVLKEFQAPIPPELQSIIESLRRGV